MMIQVEESKQPTVEEEGEQMWDWELAQQIQQLIEVTDMELEQKPQHEDVDLMPRAPQVIPQSPLAPIIVLAPRKQGDVVLLDDDPIMDVYNLSFNEFQKMIVHARMKHFVDVHASPAFIKGKGDSVRQQEASNYHF